MVKKLFSLDKHIARELEIVAKALNTTQKDIVEKALDFYFDYTDAIVADKIIEDVSDSGVALNKNKISGVYFKNGKQFFLTHMLAGNTSSWWSSSSLIWYHSR